jgi:two-component system alkaline phosphatase synthesis response regulator PhoP
MGQKILLVDDDKDLCDLYETTLKAEGFDVKIAQNGEEALSEIMKAKPDLIVLDIMMPKIHGMDTLDILKATPETKDIKVLILSALSDQKMIDKAKEFGVVDYVVKSEVDMSTVINRIKEAMAK